MLRQVLETRPKEQIKQIFTLKILEAILKARLHAFISPYKAKEGWMANITHFNFFTDQLMSLESSCVWMQLFQNKCFSQPKSILACDPWSISATIMRCLRFEENSIFNGLQLTRSGFYLFVWFICMNFFTLSTHQAHVFNHKSAFRLCFCLLCV